MQIIFNFFTGKSFWLVVVLPFLAFLLSTVFGNGGYFLQGSNQEQLSLIASAHLAAIY